MSSVGNGGDCQTFVELNGDDGSNGGGFTKSFGRNSQSFYANVINSVQ